MSIPDFHALLRELEPYGWKQSAFPPGLWRPLGKDKAQCIRPETPGSGVFRLWGSGVEFSGTLEDIAMKAKEMMR